MNIINIGGWYVGNSAILDWMDGFEELAFVKGDFNVTRLEGNIPEKIIKKEDNAFNADEAATMNDILFYGFNNETLKPKSFKYIIQYKELL